MRILAAVIAVLISLPAWAITPAELEQRLAQVEQYRQDRIGAAIPTLPANDIKKSVSNGVQTGVTEGAVYGVGILNVPIANLWSALNDETRQYHYTAVKHSELITGSKCQPGRKVLQILDIPIMFAPDKWWIGIPKPNLKIMRNSGGSVRELAFSSSVDANLVTKPAARAMVDAASPIGFSKGAWFLVAIDARHTYVEYYAYSNPGGGIPAGIASRLAAGAIKDNFDAMAKFANEGNPSCPIQ